MIHTAEMSDDTFASTDRLTTMTEVETYLRDNGYPVDEEGVWLAVNQKRDEENSAHMIKEIKTLRKPLPVADAAVDEMTILMCTCKAYRYQQGIDDLEENDTLEWEPCKHCEAVDATMKAENDENQQQL